MIILFWFFSFIFGAIIGSFLNVLIVRIPNGEDFIFKRSHCLNCSKLITWYENIPLVSYLYLKGRCSGCRQSIALRYPLVEFLLAMASLYFATETTLDLNGLLLFALKLSIFSILVVHFFIDIKHQILPDSLNFILGVLFLTYATTHFNWQYWLAGAAVGAGFPLLVTWIFYLLRGQIGLGGGDIKLYGVLGLYLGPLGIIHTIFLSCFIGALYGGAAIYFGKMDKSKPIAFGPFIIFISVIQIFFSDFFARYLIFV